MTNTVNLDWNNLGSDYIKTDLRYISHYNDGEGRRALIGR